MRSTNTSFLYALSHSFLGVVSSYVTPSRCFVPRRILRLLFLEAQSDLILYDRHQPLHELLPVLLFLPGLLHKHMVFSALLPILPFDTKIYFAVSVHSEETDFSDPLLILRTSFINQGVEVEDGCVRKLMASLFARKRSLDMSEKMRLKVAWKFWAWKSSAQHSREGSNVLALIILLMFRFTWQNTSMDTSIM